MAQTRLHSLVRGTYLKERQNGKKLELTAFSQLRVWCSGNALVSINVVILHRARLVLGWVGLAFTSSNRVRTLSVFNQPPRPTQPGHLSGAGKMSTGVKPGKVTAGYGRDVV